MDVTVISPLQSSVGGVPLVYGPPEVYTVTTPQGRSIEGAFPVIVQGKVCHHVCMCVCMFCMWVCLFVCGWVLLAYPEGMGSVPTLLEPFFRLLVCFVVGLHAAHVG